MGHESEELTQAEKRDFIERIISLVTNDILNRGDRRDIYCVCLAACSREMAKINKGEKE